LLSCQDAEGTQKIIKKLSELCVPAVMPFALDLPSCSAVTVVEAPMFGRGKALCFRFLFFVLFFLFLRPLLAELRILMKSFQKEFDRD